MLCLLSTTLIYSLLLISAIFIMFDDWFWTILRNNISSNILIELNFLFTWDTSISSFCLLYQNYCFRYQKCWYSSKGIKVMEKQHKNVSMNIDLHQEYRCWDTLHMYLHFVGTKSTSYSTKEFSPFGNEKPLFGENDLKFIFTILHPLLLNSKWSTFPLWAHRKRYGHCTKYWLLNF